MVVSGAVVAASAIEQGRVSQLWWLMEQIFSRPDRPCSDQPDYKLYCLNDKGKITRSDWIDAESDDEAIGIARAMEKSVDCEIWKGNRLVARIPALKMQA
jgi:hypothetical protein